MLNALQTSTEGEGGKHQKTNKNILITCLTKSSEKKYKESLKGGGVPRRQDGRKKKFSEFCPVFNLEIVCRGVGRHRRSRTSYMDDRKSMFI